MHEAARTSDTTKQVEIFKQRKLAEAADRLINAAADEDAGVSEAQSKAAQHGIYIRHKSRATRVALERQPKIASDNGLIVESATNFI